MQNTSDNRYNHRTASRSHRWAALIGVRRVRTMALRTVAWTVLTCTALAMLACGQDAATTAVPQATSPSADRSLESPTQALGDPSKGITALPSVADLVERIGPAVVLVSVESPDLNALSGLDEEQEAGTAIVVRQDGYLVTNSHVILGAEAVTVSLADGRVFDAEVVGNDPVSDLAVLKIDAKGLPVATLGGSERLRTGDWVVAIGNALGLKGGPTVALGIISAQGRAITTDLGQLYDLIQTDAAINQGTSGGPLVSLDGQVVGINTAILRQATGIGFAISSSVAVPIIESLIENGRVIRPLIGLTATDVTSRLAAELKLPAAEGVVVTTMSEDGPAYLAGIRVGDVITKLGDSRTPDMGRFLGRLWSYRPGDRVEVGYISSGKSHAVLVTLAERPSQ